MPGNPAVFCGFALQLVAFLVAGCAPPEEAESSRPPGELAVFETDLGRLTIRVSPGEAPADSEAFLDLCHAGHFDGLYFHRVAPGYLVQGGDPMTRDEDRSNDGYGILPSGAGEAPREGTGRLKHQRGSVSACCGSGLTGKCSQFFVMLREDAELDGQYPVFGQVIEGLDIVETISEFPGEPYPEIAGVNPYEMVRVVQCSVMTEGP